MDVHPLHRSGRRLAAGAGLSLGTVFGMGAVAEAADFTVSNTDDSGAGSLRQALIDSDNGNHPTTDRILFQSGLTGTLILDGALPGIDESLQVLGPGPDRLTISGNNSVRAFASINVGAPPGVLISGLTLTAGNSGGNVGGGVLSSDGGLTLQSMRIVGNTSGDDGGGVFASSVIVRDSTISGNNAVGIGSFGGGVIADTATIENSTISGNDAERGGGLYAGAGSVTVRNSTIAGNHADFGGGIYEEFGSPNPTLANTIVADNTVDNAGPDLLNTFNASFTLVEQTSGATVNETVAGSNITDDVTDGMSDVDPQLGPLASNGGPTQTHALPLSSPAVDKGIAAGGAATDQRGFSPRAFDNPMIANSIGAAADGADIGAFELGALLPVSPLPAGGSTTPPKGKKKCKKGRRLKKGKCVKKKRKKK